MSNQQNTPAPSAAVAAMTNAFTGYLKSDGRDDHRLKTSFHNASAMASNDERHEMVVRFVAAFGAEGGLPVSDVRAHFSSLARQYNRHPAAVAHDVAGNICDRMIDCFGEESRLGNAAKMIQGLIATEPHAFKQ